MKLIIALPIDKQDLCKLVITLDPRRLELDSSKILSPEEIKWKIFLMMKNEMNDCPSCYDPTKSSIRIVTSNRAGNGKSFWIKRKLIEIQREIKNIEIFTYKFHDTEVDNGKLITFFNECLKKSEANKKIAFYLDITNIYQLNLEELLFSLIFLHGITDNQNRIWKRDPHHYFLIECSNFASNQFKFLKYLPTIHCCSPEETLKRYASIPLSQSNFILIIFV